MSIEETLDRLATNVALIAGAISTLAEAVNGTYKGKQIYADAMATTTEAAQPPAQKRGPGRPPKAAAVQAESAPSSTPPAAAQESAASAPAGLPTKEQTQNALVALIKANKRDTVVKILGEHGAQSVSALAPEHYAAVYAKAIAATPAV